MYSNSYLLLSIAMTKEGHLSPHIVNGLLHAFPNSNFGFEDAKDVLQSKFPALPLPTLSSWEFAERTLEIHAKNHIHSLSIMDAEYPAYLKIIRNPPPALYVRGDINILERLPGVAIVGTRNVTKNGTEIAKRIASYMVQNDWVVVSGLAIGVDVAAHEGALISSGLTVAVLAHGLHKASPKQNSILADEILLKGGAWISEHVWGQEPRKEFFVQRNRIQIGLSCGSIIVESDVKSGTTTQAQFCVEANRNLFAVVPNDPENSLKLLSIGPLKLVQDKNAIPIKTRDDYPMILSLLAETKAKLLNHENLL